MIAGTEIVTEFGKFLEREMQRGGYKSYREFARRLGVVHTTITRQLEDNPPRPDPDFLIKLSDVTGIDLPTIVLVAYNRGTEHERRVRLLAARISRLSPEKFKLLQGFFDGSLFEPDDEAV